MICQWCSWMMQSLVNIIGKSPHEWPWNGQSCMVSHTLFIFYIPFHVLLWHKPNENKHGFNILPLLPVMAYFNSKVLWCHTNVRHWHCDVPFTISSCMHGWVQSDMHYWIPSDTDVLSPNNHSVAGEKDHYILQTCCRFCCDIPWNKVRWHYDDYIEYCPIFLQLC